MRFSARGEAKVMRVDKGVRCNSLCVGAVGILKRAFVLKIISEKNGINKIYFLLFCANSLGAVPG